MQDLPLPGAPQPAAPVSLSSNVEPNPDELFLFLGVWWTLVELVSDTLLDVLFYLNEVAYFFLSNEFMSDSGGDLFDISCEFYFKGSF